MASVATTCKGARQYPSNPTAQACTVECLNKAWCTTILFRSDGNVSDRCVLIYPTTEEDLNLSAWTGYEHFKIKLLVPDHSNTIEILTQVGFSSGPPILYFPLDSENGLSFGIMATQLDFNHFGNVAKGITLPDPDGLETYYNLGTFPDAQYCFPDPQICPQGASFGLWMKIGQQTSTARGFVTTRLANGPGFQLYWSSLLLLVAEVKLSNGMRHQVKIAQNVFTSGYGYDTWVHYLITYKSIADIEFYLNGLARPNSEKWSGNWSPVSDGFSGAIEVGHYSVCDSFAEGGTMSISDLMIWERQLTSADVAKLYSLYS